MHGSTAPDCLPEGSGLYWVGLELKGFRVVEYEVTEHQKRVLADPGQKANFVNEVLHVREYVELSCKSSVRLSDSASACEGCVVLCLVQVQVQVQVQVKVQGRGWAEQGGAGQARATAGR